MDNRAKILEVGLALFSARGYDGVGIQQVVDEAGVTKPTLYHYFDSKRGLLEALLEKDFAALLAACRSASSYPGDLIMRLRCVTRALFDYAIAHPQFYRMQLTLYFAPPDSEPNRAVLPYMQQQFSIMEALFASAVVEHGNMRGRQRAYAATFLGMVHTFIGLYLTERVQLNDELVIQSVHQFMHGILS